MFEKTDILTLKPFEVCSIRPPTENASLTFRLTRNCYWNKCSFCPVYKLGARFSRRSLEEILEDIHRAKALDDFMFENGIGNPVYSTAGFSGIQALGEKIRAAHWEAGCLPDGPEKETAVPGDIDPRMQWFLSWFNSSPSIEECMSHILTWRIYGGKTCFLGDGDSLILKPDFLKQVIDSVRTAFSGIERFTVYGRTGTAARLRSIRELKAFARSGLNRVHFGLESGSDAVLALMNKGVTAAEHAAGCLKTKEAGLSCSVYVMPGLGGARYSEVHARETAALLTTIAPDFIRLRSLEIFPQTRLADELAGGTFIEASEEQVVTEIRTLVSEIDAETEILSDSASNLLAVYGRLPEERERMLATIDQYLSLSAREKLEFSLRSRLRSFTDQYGGISPDLLESFSPFIRHNRLDFSSIEDSEIVKLIRLIRNKLMP